MRGLVDRTIFALKRSVTMIELLFFPTQLLLPVVDGHLSHFFTDFNHDFGASVVQIYCRSNGILSVQFNLYKCGEFYNDCEFTQLLSEPVDDVRIYPSLVLHCWRQSYS